MAHPLLRISRGRPVQRALFYARRFGGRTASREQPCLRAWLRVGREVVDVCILERRRLRERLMNCLPARWEPVLRGLPDRGTVVPRHVVLPVFKCIVGGGLRCRGLPEPATVRSGKIYSH